MNNLIVLQDDKYVLEPNTSITIADLEIKIKELTAKRDELKKIILNEMEEKNLLGVESDYITISYTGPYDREDFKKEDFKKDHKDLYDEYVKMTPVKSSIRIKVK